MLHGPRAADSRAAARRLWTYLSAHRRALALVLVLVAATTGLQLLGPLLWGRAVDLGIRAERPRVLAIMVLAIVLNATLSAACQWLQNVQMIKISQRAVRDLRRDLFRSLQGLALRYFDHHAHGDLMSRLTNDVETVNGVLSQAAGQLFGGLLTVIGAVFAMLWLNWRLTLAAVLVLPLSAGLMQSMALITRRSFRARQAALGTLNGLVEETIVGQKVVVAFRRQPRVLADFDAANGDLRRAAARAAVIGGLMGPAMNFIRNVGQAIVVGAGVWMVVVGRATVGTMWAFMDLSRQFMWPIMGIAQMYAMVQAALAGAERIFAVMDEPPEPPDVPDAKQLDTVAGEVVFDRVSFGYDPAKPVLRDVSFRAAPGQTFALVGPTGAGKTTIINLLARFYDIDAGQIRLDGHELREVARDRLRRSLGVVPQDTFLFADTVRANIRYGRLDASDEEIEQAARMANADTFIRHLPAGYETELNEAGGSLSAGQRQLLAIARAILADPAVLVLDEATSSVDTRTEAHIQEAMLRLLAGRTAFIIAHRLSTVRQADQILVIDHGQVVEQGTHGELLAAQGLYWRLHTTHYEGVEAEAGG
jgi:ATP-binding cassette subfamily B protein